MPSSSIGGALLGFDVLKTSSRKSFSTTDPVVGIAVVCGIASERLADEIRVIRRARPERAYPTSQYGSAVGMPRSQEQISQAAVEEILAPAAHRQALRSTETGRAKTCPVKTHSA